MVRFGEKCQCLLSHLTSQLSCLLPSCLPSFLPSLYWVVCSSWAGLKLGKQQQVTSHVVHLHACSQVLGIEPRASCTPSYVHFCGCNIFPGCRNGCVKTTSKPSKSPRSNMAGLARFRAPLLNCAAAAASEVPRVVHSR